MISYFDTSALIKLIIEESGSDEAAAIWDQARSPLTARITYVEARAALAAAKRGRRISSAQHRVAIADLDMLWSQMSVIEITAEIIDRAVELADSKALRGYDAVHLAVALVSGSELFTSADRQLCDAAVAAGLHVANPIDRELRSTTSLPSRSDPKAASPDTRSSGLFGIPIPLSADRLPNETYGFRLRRVGTIQEVTALYRQWMSTDGWIFDAEFSMLDPYQSEETPYVGYITQSIYAKPTTPVVTVAIIVGNFDGKPGRKKDVKLYLVPTPDDELPSRALTLSDPTPAKPDAD